jgi:streptogramin lyase
MKLRLALLLACAGLALLSVNAPRAGAQSAAALTGTVSSPVEGHMDGVLVTAKRAGSGIAYTVVSDVSGRYSFPAGKLVPGHYDLTIRAVGYDLAGPKAVDVGPGATSADVKLVPTTDLAAQLTSSEWVMSVPGTTAQKMQMLNCATCHTFARIVQSKHTADEFVHVIERMNGYSNNSSPATPQRRHDTEPLNPEATLRYAQYLASINQSNGPAQYALQTLPRPTGDGTRMIVTAYDLPDPKWEPHDVMRDRNGMIWFDDFTHQRLGMLDPATGAVTQYTVPTIKPGYPMGALDLEIAKNGHIWLANMFQGGIQEFDPQTKTFKTYPVPAPWQGERTQQTFLVPPNGDGVMYVKDNGTQNTFQVDLAKNTWKPYGPYKDATHTWGTYQIFADSNFNVYGNDFSGGYGKSIVKYDRATGSPTIYTVSQDVSRPRRGKMDAQDRLWFAEYQGGDIGVLDTKIGKVTTWKAGPWMFPYDAAPGKNGEVWAAGITSDQVLRLDPKTGKRTLYLLPAETNARDIYVDNSGDRSVFWVGNNHAGKIYKLETLGDS